MKLPVLNPNLHFKIKKQKIMNFQTTNQLQPSTPSETEKYPEEYKVVPSGFDTEFKKEIKKVFSRADLWNIQRQRKLMSSRGYF